MNPSYFLTAPWALAISMTGACIWALWATKRAGERAEKYMRDLDKLSMRAVRCDFCGDLEVSTQWRAKHSANYCYFCYSFKDAIGGEQLLKDLNESRKQ